MKITITAFTPIVLGLLVAWGASSLISYGLEPHEMQNCKAGKPLFDRPMPESIAAEIAKECQEWRGRQFAVARYRGSGTALFAARFISFLVDPINLGLTAIFSWAAFAVLSVRILIG